MGKGKTIWVDEETYRRLKAMAEELNMKSIAELLRFIAGTHPSIRLFVDKPEEFYRNVIDGIRYTLGIQQVSNKKSIEKPQQRYRTSSHQNLDSPSYNDTTSSIHRAKKYRDKIIKEQGYITEDQLKKVAEKFGVEVSELWDDLVMKEQGKYYPY